MLKINELGHFIVTVCTLFATAFKCYIAVNSDEAYNMGFDHTANVMKM